MKSGDGKWFAALLVAIALALGLRLAQALVSIERTDLAYAIRATEKELDEKRELVGKLEVERNNLRSQGELARLAKTFKLGPAEPGQIRSVGGPGG